MSKQYQTNGSKAKMFGLLPSRKKEIGTYIKDDQKGHLIVWLTSFNNFHWVFKMVVDGSIKEIIMAAEFFPYRTSFLVEIKFSSNANFNSSLLRLPLKSKH